MTTPWPPRIAFPYATDGRGRTASCTEERHLRDLIEQVLLTAPGERVMRPTFGGGLLQRVFEPGGPELLASTQYLVQAALTEHLGNRIAVDRLELSSREEYLVVTVSWTLLRNQRRSTSTITVPGTTA